MTIRELTKKDTSVIKGIAILCIVLHNYFHHTFPFTGENEFDFEQCRVFNFIHLLFNQPFDIVNTLFSYLGHYGVQAFIFISGYGLTKSMLAKKQDWLGFTIDRLKKLYPLILTGCVLFVATIAIVNQRNLYGTEWNCLIRKLFFIHTLTPNDGLSFIGPWWFFGLIFQLYLLFPALFKLIKKHGTFAFMAISFASLCIVYFETFGLISNEYITVMQNAPGHLAEFALGIWIALNNGVKIPTSIGFFAIAAFILGNFIKAFFPLTFISAAFVIWWISASANVNGGKCKILSFIGSLSMIIFVANGFIRDRYTNFFDLETSRERYLVAVILLISVIIISFIGRYLYNLLVKFADTLICGIRRIELFRRKRHIIATIAKILPLTVLAYILLFYATLKDCSFDNDSIQIDGNELSIEPDMEYVSLANNIKLKHNYVKFNVTIDFDITESSKEMPIVVFDIKNKFWDKSSIIGKDGHCSIQKDFIVSGFSRHNVLKIYIWNITGSNLKIKNLNTRIDGTHSIF